MVFQSFNLFPHIYSVTECDACEQLLAQELQYQANLTSQKRKSHRRRLNALLLKYHSVGSKEDLCKDCDLIVQAAFEDTECKGRTTFAELETTSAQARVVLRFQYFFPFLSQRSETDSPVQLLSMHFFNPADRMKLVEVIAGVNTLFFSAETVEKINKIRCRSERLR